VENYANHVRLSRLNTILTDYPRMILIAVLRIKQNTQLSRLSYFIKANAYSDDSAVNR
jgi:hypothetical protein